MKPDLDSECAIVAAYIRDRAAQYADDCFCAVALHDVAELIERRLHRDAFNHGDLDDLLDQKHLLRTEQQQSSESQPEPKPDDR